MSNIKWFLVFSLLWLSGCNALGTPVMGPDGKPLPKVYKLKRQNSAEVKFRMLDAVNALRIAKGVQVLEFSAEFMITKMNLASINLLGIFMSFSKDN